MNEKIALYSIDDDEGMRKSIAAIFIPLGCDVSGDESAEKALEKLNSGYVPDIIILDLKLPGMNGAKLFRLLSEDQRWSKIPVVPFTASWKEKNQPTDEVWREIQILLKEVSPKKIVKIVKKEKGASLTVPETLVLTVASHLKREGKRIPGPYRDAILDLLEKKNLI